MTSKIKCSSPATLKKYGMDAEMWYAMLDLQGGICPVCGQEFTEERRPVIDHEHRRGYKKMRASQKVRYIRGLLHSYCNRRMVAKGMTAEKAYAIYLYLSDYDVRLLDE